MSRSKQPRRKPRNAYHHGDLRAALLASARREIELGGVEAVSLKALAEGLGVSQPAPYRHFADREALLQAVAAGGFRDFIEALKGAGEGVEAMAEAYMDFARRHAGLYRLMFASRLVPNAAPESELEQVADESFALLLDAVGKRVPAARAQASALRIWASLHGLVMLEAEGFLKKPIAAGVELGALVQAAAAVG